MYEEGRNRKVKRKNMRKKSVKDVWGGRTEVNKNSCTCRAYIHVHIIPKENNLTLFKAYLK